jgi:Arc/MetJ family transcription regulator
MSRDYIRFRATREREKALGRACEALGNDTESEVVDAALRHLIESVENLEDVKSEVSPELADRLSTSEVSLAMYPQVKR